MKFNDLRQFIAYLESIGELKRITYPVSPAYEITEIADRVLRAGGPALLFENPIGYDMPVLANLFGTPKRVALGMGQQEVSALREVGKLLAYLKEPAPPTGVGDLLNKLPALSKIRHMPVKRVKHAPCQHIIWAGDEVDLDKLPVMSCWPQDVAPLLTWGLTITKGPHKKRQNLGIYRQQKIARNKVIMRWLAHRGGALDLQDWITAHPGQPFPVSVAFGADPATILAAVTPIPDTLSEYAFAGLLRGAKSAVVKSISNELDVPATAEIVLEGYIDPNEFADEGPYGDHTGYYNEVERHHVFTITHITMRQAPIYHSTYTGRPPDEPAVLGVALNEVFVPILQKQFPEIADFYLPPEGCSYRMAVVTIHKQYAGHAKRIMMGVWSFLRQFMYTKYVVVCDQSVNARNWDSVAQALSQHFAPRRDALIIDNTPIDSLDFASPVVGLGSKIGLDATIKWQAELEVEPAPLVEREIDNHQALSLSHPDIIATHMLGASVLAVQIQSSQIHDRRALLSQIWQQAPKIKLVLLCDEDVNITDWNDIIWALTTRVDPARDSVLFTQAGWSQLSFDATNKSGAQVSREWGKPIYKDPQLVAKIDAIWEQLGLQL